MGKKNVILNAILKKMDKKRNYVMEEIKYDDLISEKHKKVCMFLSYFEHFLVFVSAVSGCVSISAFHSLVGVTVRIAKSVVGKTTCALTGRTKN